MYIFNKWRYFSSLEDGNALETQAINMLNDEKYKQIIHQLKG